MDFESILEEILLGRGQGNLKPKSKTKVETELFTIDHYLLRESRFKNEKYCFE